MQASPGSARQDPYKDYTLYVSAGNQTCFGSKLTGLIPPLEVVQHRAGGDPSRPIKSPGRAQYEPITLNRGATQDQSFTDWASQIAAALSPANVAEYRDGDESVDSPREVTGRSGLNDITLNRGVTQDQSFNNWANSVSNYGSGSGAEVPPASYRKSIILQFSNEAGQIVVRYQIGPHGVLKFPGGGQGVSHHPLFPGGIRRLREQLAAIFENSLDEWIKRQG